jgi:hypothetical protein
MMAMMADTENTTVTWPAGELTQNMTTFPSGPAPLYGNPGSRYLMKPQTQYWYTVDTDGTVRGYWDSAGAGEIGKDDPP